MKRISQFINSILEDRRKALLSMGGVVFFILVLIIFSFINRGGDKPQLPSGGIDQELGFEEDSDVVIGEDLDLPDVDEGDKLEVYQFNRDGHEQNVDQMMQKLGKGFWKKEAYEGINFLWTQPGGDPNSLYLVEYNTIREQLFFRFETPVDLDQIGGGGVLNTTQMQQLLPNFFSSFLNLDFTFTNYNIIKTGNNYRIEANRVINGLPLEIGGFEKHSDYIVINESGDLLEGVLYLFEYEDGVEVELIEPELLGQVINRSDYPKEFNDLGPIGFDYSTISEPYEPVEGFLGDPPDIPEDAIPKTENCRVHSMELVYYFVRVNTDRLAPAYKLECTGEVTIKGEKYEVPVIIYANALDPEVVFVPGTIDTSGL